MVVITITFHIGPRFRRTTFFQISDLVIAQVSATSEHCAFLQSSFLLYARPHLVTNVTDHRVGTRHDESEVGFPGAHVPRRQRTHNAGLLIFHRCCSLSRRHWPLHRIRSRARCRAASDRDSIVKIRVFCLDFLQPLSCS